MTRIDPNPLAIERSFKETLKGKSRRRREDLARLAAPAAAARALRNDVLPHLGIVYVPLDDLHSPARKVRARDPAHMREVAGTISALGFCVPILIGKNNLVIDGEARLEAAKLLGLDRAPCVRIGHLSEDEQRVSRLAANRLGEKGQWNLDELKIEFEELILADAPIEISGFSLDEIDQIVIGDELDVAEQGPLEPDPRAAAVARLGDHFQLGPHQLICGDATDPTVLTRLMDGAPPARLILTDEPYNVKIAGHVTGGDHREFAMASGEMSDVEFLGFNVGWIKSALPHLCDGGVFGTYIDWRGLPTVHSAAVQLDLTPLNLIVWAKSNAGMGSLYRSQHELLPLFKKGDAPHVNNIELGKRGRSRSNVWTYPGRLVVGLRRAPRLAGPSDGQADCDAGGRAPRPHQSRRHRARSVPRLGLDTDRRRQGGAHLPRRRAGSALCRCDHQALRGGDGRGRDSPGDRRDLRGCGDAECGGGGADGGGGGGAFGLRLQFWQAATRLVAGRTRAGNSEPPLRPRWSRVARRSLALFGGSPLSISTTQSMTSRKPVP